MSYTTQVKKCPLKIPGFTAFPSTLSFLRFLFVPATCGLGGLDLKYLIPLSRAEGKVPDGHENKEEKGNELSQLTNPDQTKPNQRKGKRRLQRSKATNSNQTQTTLQEEGKFILKRTNSSILTLKFPINQPFLLEIKMQIFDKYEEARDASSLALLEWVEVISWGFHIAKCQMQTKRSPYCHPLDPTLYDPSTKPKS